MLVATCFEHVRAGGGGGGSVASGRYIRVIVGYGVGIYVDVYLWLTVGELRLLEVHVSLWGCAPRW